MFDVAIKIIIKWKTTSTTPSNRFQNLNRQIVETGLKLPNKYTRLFTRVA
jgi:hypothetical protein